MIRPNPSSTPARSARRASPRQLAPPVTFAAAVVLVALAASGCGPSIVRPSGPPVFYPPLPEQPHIQFLTSITSEEDLGGGGAFTEFVAGKEDEARTLRKPYGAAIHGDRIYVADTGLGRIVVVDLDSGSFEEFAGDTGPGRVQTPINVTIGEDGHKFVSDTKREAVLEYDAQDRFVRIYGEAGQFRPSDVAVTGDRLYVCDVRDHEVEVLDRKSGAVVLKFGQAGSEEGQLVFPTNLALDAAGNVYVTDTGNFRVQKFSPEGALLATFGGIGDTFGTFTRPKGLAVDPEGRIYVVDAAFENVQLFDPEFQLLLAFGGPGGEPGNLWLPSVVEVTTEGLDYFGAFADPAFAVKYLVLVVSQYGPRRLNIFGFGDWTGAVPPTGPAPTPAPTPAPAVDAPTAPAPAVDAPTAPAPAPAAPAPADAPAPATPPIGGGDP